MRMRMSAGSWTVQAPLLEPSVRLICERSSDRVPTVLQIPPLVHPLTVEGRECPDRRRLAFAGPLVYLASRYSFV